MKRVKSISFSRGLTDSEFEKLSVILEEEFGIDFEPVYEVSDIEKEVINFSLKLVEMGHTVTWEQTRRNVEKIWKELEKNN